VRGMVCCGVRRSASAARQRNSQQRSAYAAAQCEHALSCMLRGLIAKQQQYGYGVASSAAHVHQCCGYTHCMSKSTLQNKSVVKAHSQWQRTRAGVRLLLGSFGSLGFLGSRGFFGGFGFRLRPPRGMPICGRQALMDTRWTHAD